MLIHEGTLPRVEVEAIEITSHISPIGYNNFTENFNFEKYFADDTEVQNAYTRFTNYLTENSSVHPKIHEEQLYD